MNQEAPERGIPEALFGKIRKRPRTGGFEPDPHQLHEPLPSTEEECVGYIFCGGCGFTAPFLREALNSVVQVATLPSDSYIRVDGCDWCGDRLENPRIVRRPQ